MNTPKRATVYFDPAIHRALRLRAAAPDQSISDMVNQAVKRVFAVASYRVLIKPSAAREIEGLTKTSWSGSGRLTPDGRRR